MRLLLTSVMDTDSKISFKIDFTESYKHNSKESNDYIYKNFKNGVVHKGRIQKVKIKQKGIDQTIVIIKRKNFSERVFKANES